VLSIDFQGEKKEKPPRRWLGRVLVESGPVAQSHSIATGKAWLDKAFEEFMVKKQ
jgi:hypothetical protein